MITMGAFDFIIRAFGGEVKEKPDEGRKEIKGYELYGHAHGGKWTKLLDLEEPIDFEELEDAEPGNTYKLVERFTSGQLRQVWYRHLQGETVSASSDPIKLMREALAPMKAFGAEMQGLREDVQGAFGWAFPEPQGGGGGVDSPEYSGTLPIYLHPAAPRGAKEWGPVLREWTKDITAGIKEGLNPNGSQEPEKKTKALTFSSPSPDVNAFLEEASPELEG